MQDIKAMIAANKEENNILTQALIDTLNDQEEYIKDGRRSLTSLVRRPLSTLSAVLARATSLLPTTRPKLLFAVKT